MKYNNETMNCPKCGEECWRDSADVGVGIIYGPWGCPKCCWSEWSEYDRSEGESPANVNDITDWITDQFGISHNKQRLAEEISEIVNAFVIVE